jgi:hypothetical protein
MSLGVGVAQATPITSTDTIGLNLSEYLQQEINLLDIGNTTPPQLTGGELLILLNELDASLLARGGCSLWDLDDCRCPPWRAHCHKQTVPEPGVLGLGALGLVGVALAVRRNRRLRASTA